MERLSLSDVTLCAAASVNVAATLEALRASMDQVDFAQCLFFTDAPLDPPKGISVVPIERLNSGKDYSEFLLRRLADHIETSHCLIVQWDGFVLDSRQWSTDFLHSDYIGARWPQFDDGCQVGNGGFSLRSRRLLEACGSPDFIPAHPEDIAICRLNRKLLEKRHGLRFADPNLADRFAFERSEPAGKTFGFHGVFNMIPLLGADRFWRIYRSLDDPSTAFVDYARLLRQLGQYGSGSLSRPGRLTIDRLRHALGKRVRSSPALGHPVPIPGTDRAP